MHSLPPMMIALMMASSTKWLDLTNAIMLAYSNLFCQDLYGKEI